MSMFFPEGVSKPSNKELEKNFYDVFRDERANGAKHLASALIFMQRYYISIEKYIRRYSITNETDIKEIEMDLYEKIVDYLERYNPDHDSKANPYTYLGRDIQNAICVYIKKHYGKSYIPDEEKDKKYQKDILIVSLDEPTPEGNGTYKDLLSSQVDTEGMIHKKQQAQMGRILNKMNVHAQEEEVKTQYKKRDDDYRITRKVTNLDTANPEDLQNMRNAAFAVKFLGGISEVGNMDLFEEFLDERC